MKDLTEQIYDELNAQVVRMLEHSLNQASHIAELETKLQEQDAMLGRRPCINNRCMDMVSAQSRIADLERQLAEASAPAVERAPIGYLRQSEIDKLADGRVAGVGMMLHKEPGEGKVAVYKAPQAADTDKVREAILKLNPHEKTVLGHVHGAGAYCEGFDHGIAAAAELVTSMAAQAPVREVPEGWKLVPVEPTLDMIYAFKFARRSTAYTRGQGRVDGPTVEVHTAPESFEGCYRAMLAAAPLPAAPVQQEGDRG